ncbi:uncharacterized protein LOC113499047 [Trichoplusia ni]|uniref:Uncharacterized protein LOC113499047 n=1 Tax=Trichoplusia ni TaxID=7111 RepID=A0A7E5W3H4_TRINI|nr:uncharacterized protein LOC113499047 [Trichoplusia ni]
MKGLTIAIAVTIFSLVECTPIKFNTPPPIFYEYDDEGDEPKKPDENTLWYQQYPKPGEHPFDEIDLSSMPGLDGQHRRQMLNSHIKTIWSGKIPYRNQGLL